MLSNPRTDSKPGKSPRLRAYRSVNFACRLSTLVDNSANVFPLLTFCRDPRQAVSKKVVSVASSPFQR